VPEPLGLDDQGREILSLLPGRPATYPLPRFTWSDATLRAVATTLRAYHDASAGFEPPAGATWRWPAGEPAEVICHNDFAPYNLMFEHGRLTGVIDLDLASPRPRIRDLGYAAYRFVPLTDPANPDAPFPGAREQARRLRVFCLTYDDDRITPADVVTAAIDKLSDLVDFIRRAAASGDPAQRIVLERGDVDIYQRDIEYLTRLSSA
jgi:aminoglycoside phosphotransferase (APT) family kinase protein